MQDIKSCPHDKYAVLKHKQAKGTNLQKKNKKSDTKETYNRLDNYKAG
jgi:hypothetical protein